MALYILGFKFLSHLFFTLMLGYYVMSAMQWYSYKLERVVLHYQRYDWHLYFFLIPIFVYYLGRDFFWIYLYLIFLPTLFFWYRKLDKKLVFTARVKRFFVFLFLVAIFQNIVCLSSEECMLFGVLIPILSAILVSMLFEKILFVGYKNKAAKVLAQRSDLIIIAITASYGKTSIKNYLYEILKEQYICYKTPRSVNTLGGIIKDINEDLPKDAQIYIVEAGARASGDIREIAELVRPHYALVGQIGEQHLEYFKNLENIRNTKMELLQSSRLIKAFVHQSATIKPDEKTVVFGPQLQNVNATLDNLSFDISIDDKNEHFVTPLLGAFNATNLLACILLAREFVELQCIKNSISKLEGVAHRLSKMQSGGKLIIDDSFNGNLEGMLGSYDLIATYEGRKVIVTPGIVESTRQANEVLGERIDGVFDLVILTGKGNMDILDQSIKKAQKIKVPDKTKIEQILQEYTQYGDVILFSNDTPSYM